MWSWFPFFEMVIGTGHWSQPRKSPKKEKSSDHINLKVAGYSRRSLRGHDLWVTCKLDWENQRLFTIPCYWNVLSPTIPTMGAIFKGLGHLERARILRPEYVDWALLKPLYKVLRSCWVDMKIYSSGRAQDKPPKFPWATLPLQSLHVLLYRQGQTVNQHRGSGFCGTIPN